MNNAYRFLTLLLIFQSNIHLTKFQPQNNPMRTQVLLYMERERENIPNKQTNKNKQSHFGFHNSSQ
ncbi:hypothetical protein GLYMA_09G078601v4 [Glycine max]|nr:hypothetical protein GLYMA_09G078601v4 [Glycine max]KAH1042035.1 hypothetical protein GYH30_024382 [Glycine max]